MKKGNGLYIGSLVLFIIGLSVKILNIITMSLVLIFSISSGGNYHYNDGIMVFTRLTSLFSLMSYMPFNIVSLVLAIISRKTNKDKKSKVMIILDSIVIALKLIGTIIIILLFVLGVAWAVYGLSNMGH